MDNKLGQGKSKMRECRSVLGLALLLLVPKVGFGDEPVAFQKLGEAVRARDPPDPQ